MLSFKLAARFVIIRPYRCKKKFILKLKNVKKRDKNKNTFVNFEKKMSVIKLINISIL